MRKIGISLIILMVVLALPPPAAWANSVALGPPNSNWLQLVAINNNGTGSSHWNQFQAEFHGASFMGGYALNGGSWDFSSTNNLIVGTGPVLWHSTLYLGLAMVPLTQPLYIDIFQFNNGVLLNGATTRLLWSGKSWTATNMPNLSPTSVPEPTTWVLLGMSALVGGVLRKRLS